VAELGATKTKCWITEMGHGAGATSSRTTKTGGSARPKVLTLGTRLVAVTATTGLLKAGQA
jgi:hypothetical protein